MTKPALRPAYDALAAEIVQRAQGRPILFFLNDGNWGDSLIREGAEQFFQVYDIPYYMVKTMDVSKGKRTLEEVLAKIGHANPLAVFNGGGSYDPRYGRLPFLKKLTERFCDAVFMPASFPKEMAQVGFPDTVRFYTRDRSSSQNNMPEARFCHDMAFFLDLAAPVPDRSVGFFMRMDSERPEDAPLPPGNRDISKEGRAHTPIQKFVSAIARYDVIHTNRLHVNVCAALLGRRVHFYPNDHFKNEAVFEATLREHFPQVTFEQTYAALTDALAAGAGQKRRTGFWQLFKK